MGEKLSKIVKKSLTKPDSWTIVLLLTMNKRLKDLALQIKDLEAEYDYYCLYEPEDRESAGRVRRWIDKAHNEHEDLKKRIETEKLDGVRESSFPNK